MLRTASSAAALAATWMRCRDCLTWWYLTQTVTKDARIETPTTTSTTATGKSEGVLVGSVGPSGGVSVM